MGVGILRQNLTARVRKEKSKHMNGKKKSRFMRIFGSDAFVLVTNQELWSNDNKNIEKVCVCCLLYTSDAADDC